jgi:hypothetical protein
MPSSAALHSGADLLTVEAIYLELEAELGS